MIRLLLKHVITILKYFLLHLISDRSTVYSFYLFDSQSQKLLFWLMKMEILNCFAPFALVFETLQSAVVPSLATAESVNSFGDT